MVYTEVIQRKPSSVASEHAEHAVNQYRLYKAKKGGVSSMSGKIIAIEGTDGSGKHTQTQLLVSYLTSIPKKRVGTYSFPMYKKNFFGREVADYLNGEYGALDEVKPKVAAMLYAGDRLEALRGIKLQLMNNYTIVMDRYVQSNIIHQGAKETGHMERQHLIEWIEELEYNVFKLPRPDLTIFLDVPPEYSDKMVEAKSKRDYTDKKKDLHEADINYMQSVYDLSEQLAIKEGWHIITCVKDKQVRPIEDIHKDIRNVVDLAYPLKIPL